LEGIRDKVEDGKIRAITLAGADSIKDKNR